MNAILARRSCAISRQLQQSRRLFTAKTSLSADTPFASGPSPPRLPEAEQRVYEQLQKQSTGAFSTPRPAVVVNQSPTPSSESEARARVPPQINQSPHNDPTKAMSAEEQDLETINAKVTAQGEGDELHPDVRRGARPEFEGERNPKTGEVGGPKNDPLRWGGEVDWSYNGRVTDF